MNEIEPGGVYVDARDRTYRCDSVVAHSVPILPIPDYDEFTTAAIKVAVCRAVGDNAPAGRFYFFMDGQRVGSTSPNSVLVRRVSGGSHG